MKKRGQITAFILLGILILFSISLIIFLANILKTTPAPNQQTFQFLPIENYLENCLKQNVQSNFLLLGKQGMQYKTPKEYEKVYVAEYHPEIGYKEYNIPYYIYKNKSGVPNIEEIEKEISAKAKEGFTNCYDILYYFKDQGYSFEQGNITTETKISESNILIKLNPNLKITKGGATKGINEITTSINYRFMEKYDIIKKFIEEQAKDTGYVLIGFLTNLAYENNFTFETYQVSNSTIAYEFIFDDYPYGNRPFKYRFLANYNWKEKNEK